MTGIIRKANLLSHSKWTITVKDREKEELPKRILPPLCVLDVLKRQGFWGSLLWVDWRLPRWYWQGGLYSKGDWPPVSRGEGLRGFTVWGHSWIFCSTPQGGWCQRSGFAAGCDRLNARWIKPKRKAGEKLPGSQVLSGRKFDIRWSQNSYLWHLKLQQLHIIPQPVIMMSKMMQTKDESI